MSHALPVVEPEALSRAEAVYRQHLTHEPQDTVARLSLAWCLFMQALHQAGRESALGRVPVAPVPLPPPQESPSAVDPEARQFLLDCLRQTTAVVHLSQSAQDRRDVEKLRALVRLCNGDEVMSAAEAEAVRILDEITREISHSPGCSRLERLAGESAGR